jgi:hypothetical protein
MGKSGTKKRAKKQDRGLTVRGLSRATIGAVPPTRVKPAKKGVYNRQQAKTAKEE